LRFAICHLLICLCLIAGCDQAPATPVATVPAIEKSGPGVVRGKVTFEGTPPTPAKLDNSICHAAGEIFDETVLVGPDGGLKNAVVYVANVRGPLDQTPEPAVLDQKDCRFDPHVVAVRVGQTLRITNSEAEMHNVHGNPSANPSFNHGFMGKGSKDVTFAKPEFMKVKCDVHPWMSAYIGVFESSYFAVTDDDGRFDIAGLPTGTYELRVWHERYGEQKQLVTIETGPADVNFVYKALQ
jgi:plastocyanin